MAYKYKPSKEATRRQTESRNRRVRAYMNAVKSHPCMDCSQSFPPYCMDLDHRDGETKDFELSDILNKTGYSWVRIDREIAKCDLVCANCHRARTHRRGYQTTKTKVVEAQLLFGLDSLVENAS